jgi:hypothetical protein
MALDHAHMQERVAGAIRKRDKAEALIWVVPLNDGSDGWTGGCFELRAARRRKAKIARRLFVAVVIKRTAAGRAKASVSVTHVGFSKMGELPYFGLNMAIVNEVHEDKRSRLLRRNARHRYCLILACADRRGCSPGSIVSL